jgi:hypothetical protein
MTTPLPRGKMLARQVPSQIHDARRCKALVVELDHTTSLPMIRLRPKGKRTGVEVSVDGLYYMLVKRAVRE